MSVYSVVASPDTLAGVPGSVPRQADSLAWQSHTALIFRHIVHRLKAPTTTIPPTHLSLPPPPQVLATCEHEPTIVYADLDYAQLLERRTNMPLVQQKRFDLYTLVDKSAA
jgi:hypothetical protein